MFSLHSNNMNQKRGQLIVIDGIDGSGKTTQIAMLLEYLRSRGTPCEAISFPRYEENLYGKMVKRYLEGEFGDISQVNPYLMALAYAGDRFLAKPLIEQWLAEGKVVIANRYVSASKAHMSANLPEEKREEFINWLDKLEYETNGMPCEDLTILLNVDPKTGQKNVVVKNQTDIHEDSLRHLEEASKNYLSLAKREANWYVVDCVEDGQMKPREVVHKEIINVLK